MNDGEYIIFDPQGELKNLVEYLYAILDENTRDPDANTSGGE